MSTSTHMKSCPPLFRTLPTGLIKDVKEDELILDLVVIPVSQNSITTNLENLNIELTWRTRTGWTWKISPPPLIRRQTASHTNMSQNLPHTVKNGRRTLVQIFLDIYPAISGYLFCWFLSSYFWINVLNRTKIQKWQDNRPEITGLQYPWKTSSSWTNSQVFLDNYPATSG